MSDYIIEAEGLTKRFTLDAGFFARGDRFVYAVNDLSFGIERGKTYGLVGESGCGKTTTARMLVRMYKADGGAVWYSPREKKVEGASDESALIKNDRKNILDFNRKELRDYREKIKYVFQDPSRSLNPRFTVFNILTASYRYSSSWPGKKIAYEEAEHIMDEVGLVPADLEKHPSEFSGGQRQRISIARALIMKPEVMFCDEVVSALDVSVQSQILNLLQSIRSEREISFLFIAHDLRVSCYFCDTIGVMYRGLLVEEAPAQDLYKTAAHPYTKLLFQGSDNFQISSSQEVKTALESLHCCPFAHRCPYVSEKCRTKVPDWKEISSGHKVRCNLEY